MGDGWSREGYPDDWDSRREAVYARDGHTCQNCGVKGGPFGDTELHCHHIVPKSEGGSHRKSNLTTLCRGCHNKVHDHHIPKMSEVSNSRSNTSVSTSYRTSDGPAPENLRRIGQKYGQSQSSFETNRSQYSVDTDSTTQNTDTSETDDARTLQDSGTETPPPLSIGDILLYIYLVVLALAFLLYLFTL